MTRRRRLLRWAGGLGAVFLVLTALVHIPAVQRIMGWTRDGEGVCPFGYGQKARSTIAVHFAEEARSRPALDWRLTSTDRTAIEAWARERGIACEALAGGTTLECPRLPTTALVSNELPASAIWFELDSSDRVHSIRTVRRTDDVRLATRAFDSVRANLVAALGPPSNQQGSSAADTLAAGTLRQAGLEFLRRDYVATVRVTNMGDGYALTESYAARPR